MRSIVFFVIVFSTLLLTLYLVVDRGPARSKQTINNVPNAPTSVSETDVKAEETRNTFEHPFYDTEKGRLAYLLKGELPHDVSSLIIDTVHELKLLNGVLEIPIYEDMASSLPAIDKKTASRFVLNFKQAHYRQIAEGRAREKRVVQLSGGGHGSTDDGTSIHFEELEVVIERRDKNFYSIQSKKPVSIGIKGGLLDIYSVNGMSGKFAEDKDLERLYFVPPVRTYIDARSASLFSLGKAESTATLPTGDGKVAITCDGPLVLDRTSPRPRIEFRDNVYIFPVANASPTEQPVRGDTWFHCDRVSLFIDDSGDGNAMISEAIGAPAEGERVHASYRGFRADGARLVWKSFGIESKTGDLQSEARLTGSPTFTGPELEVSAMSAVFMLNEHRIILEDSVRGIVRGRTRDDEVESADNETTESAAGSESRGDLAFEADRASVIFEDRPDSGETASGKKKRRKKRDKTSRSDKDVLGDVTAVARFVAESDTDDGLVARSLGSDDFELRGRRLVYSRDDRQALVEGGSEARPEVRHRKSTGGARRFYYLFDERILRLDGGVHFDVHEDDLRGLSKKPDETTESADAAPEETGTAKPSSDVLAKGLSIDGDQIDVSFTPENDVETITARSTTGKPLRVEPSDPESRYKIEGPLLVFDVATQTAHMEASAIVTESVAHAPRLLFPRLLFETGEMVARKLRFERNNWTAYLDDGVKIEGYKLAAAEGAEESTDDTPTVIRAERAEVKFFEDFASRGTGEGCFGGLQSVEGIHAWAASDGHIEIRHANYSATADEAIWDERIQELHLLGEREQVFRRLENGRVDVLRARGIVYNRAEGKIVLSREVEGKFHLGGSSGEQTLWEYQTDSMIANVRESENCKNLELLSLEARDRVFVESKTEGIQLHGDDLHYDHGRGEIRVFSKVRSQTLTYARKDPHTGEMKTNKIDARTIRLSYTTDPLAEEDSSARENNHIVVRFEDDVTAGFHVPVQLGEEIIGNESTESQSWELRADYLALRILKKGPKKQPVRLAYALGDVDVTSEDLRANCKEAIYDESQGRLWLLGDRKTKAHIDVQISGQSTPLSDEMIILTKQGEDFEFHTKGRRSGKLPALGNLAPRADQ